MKRGWLDQELTFSQAAAELQRENDPIGRKLRNMVIAQERILGREIAIRLAGKKEPKLRITIGELYRSIPRLRPARVDDLARLVKPMLDRQEERQEARTRTLIREINDRDVLPRVENAESRLEKVEKKATAIERCLAELKAIELQELTGTGEN